MGIHQMLLVNSGGATSGTIAITDRLLLDTPFYPSEGEAWYGLNASGTVTLKDENGVTTPVGEWANGATASDYEVRATTASGDLPTSGDVLASWLNLGTSRYWAWTKTGIGLLNGAITVEIRDVATSTVQDTATITAYVEVFDAWV